MIRGPRRAILAFIVLAAIVSSGMVFAAAPGTTAVVGDFEIDGNLVDSTPPAAPYDWDTLPGAVFFDDPEVNSGCPAGEDDIFGGSSVEENPGEWIFECGSAPQKDDFLEAGIGTREIGDSTWMYLYFIRKFSGGSAVLNYEFNRNSGEYDNDGDPSTPSVPIRTAGDLLVNLEVSNGGANTIVKLYLWDGDERIGNWTEITSGSPVQGVDWDVATNADRNDRQLRFTLAELAIRLEAFGFTPTCPGLGKAWIKSNTTFDFENGVLKDRTVRKDVPLSNCAVKDWALTLSPQGIAGATVFAVYTVEGGETRELQLTDPEGDGTYTATDAQIPPGTVSFHFEVRNGDAVIWRSEESSETFAEGERKLNEEALAFKIELTPDSAENFVGDPHTFTATVTDVATGLGLPNVPVNFALANGDPDECGSIDPTSGTTDANGQVTTTVSSATPCTTDVVAWINGTQEGATSGFDGGEESDVSTKMFVKYEVTITPPAATNEAGKEHTFIVRLTRDDDGTPDAVAGASLDLALVAPEGSDAHFTEINGAPASGTGGQCTTRADDPATAVDEAGTCEVKIVATTPGSVRLDASYTATDSEGHTRIITGHADKAFHAFDLTISPTEADNEIGRPHSFTVTLTQNTGSGSAGYPGQTVDLEIDPGTSGAHFSEINGAPASGTEAQCVTRADDPATAEDEAGTCLVTITGSTAGTAVLTATWQTELDSGTVTETATATKHFLDFKVTVTPKSAFNKVGDPHTFEIRLTRNDGSGFEGFAGQTVHLSLDTATDAHFTEVNGAPASGTEADCVTSTDDPATPDDEGGFCTATITSSQAGAVRLTATWTSEVGGATVTRSDFGDKVFIAVTVSKTACPSIAPAGGIVDYAIQFSFEGAPLTNATLVDDVPDGVEIVDASSIAGADADASSGDVIWSWDTLPAGSYSGTIRVRIDEATPTGTVLTNTVTLDADEITPESATQTVTVGDEGRGGSARAFGLSLDLLGSELIPPTPDSDTTNPGELLSIPDPLGSSTPLIKLLSVSESDDSTGTQESHSATATALDVDLNVPGVLHLQASTVVAKSSSQASATGAGSSRGGSLIQNLIINGHEYGNVSQPTTVNVLDPLSGDVLAEVHLLETTRSGAAAGETQPNASSFFASGMAVNGIHVQVHLLDLADLIVSHAESSATFPSGLGCGEGLPAVSGSAYALGVNLKPDSPGGIDLGSVKVTEVNLPITGGEDSEQLLHLDIPGVVVADAAGASTEGEITDGDDEDAVAIEATSESHIAEADILDGTITATLIKATSHSEVGAVPQGSATIAHLEIGGTDICAALGLDSVCTPEPNTVLLIPGGPVLVELNEQIEEPGGLTVNAVHIWILGEGNPFGLPVGADIVIANAHSDAHPAPAGGGATETVATINVRALSSPSAAKLSERIDRPRRYELPVATTPVRVPEVSVPDIVRDPVTVLEDLAELPIAEEVLDEAKQLVETLTDPEALLEALSDPATLLEGLDDPAAAIDALVAVLGVDDAAAEDAESTATIEEELVARLRRLAGLD